MKAIIITAIYIAMTIITALAIVKDKRLKEFFKVEDFNEEPMAVLSTAIAAIFWPGTVLLWIVTWFIKTVSKK